MGVAGEESILGSSCGFDGDCVNECREAGELGIDEVVGLAVGARVCCIDSVGTGRAVGRREAGELGIDEVVGLAVGARAVCADDMATGEALAAQGF